MHHLNDLAKINLEPMVLFCLWRCVQGMLIVIKQVYWIEPWKLVVKTA